MTLLIPVSVLSLVWQVEPQHATKVAALAQHAAPLLGLAPDLAWAAGLVHDLGKLTVPAYLLQAARPLARHEWSVLRDHPVEGEMLIRTHWPDAPVALLHAVRHHHERTDGSGYPDRLMEVPLLTALVAGADVYDAVRTTRSYQPARSAAAAQEILREVALPACVIDAVLSAGEVLREVWAQELVDSGAA